LLLESGLAALLLAPAKFRTRLADGWEAPRTARLLFLWLLFRLIFGSGLVKLGSGDPNWRNLSALSYHYWTQPLPLWTSWYAAKLPLWFQRLSCLGVFLVELGAPVLLLFRATRKTALAAIIGFMFLIACTGNYCFFNLLTVLLCLLQLEDRDWPLRLRTRLVAQSSPVSEVNRPTLHIGLWPTLPAAVLALLTVAPFAAQCGLNPAWPTWLTNLEDTVAPLRSANTYGLFAVMTTQRREISLEGSDDGKIWKEYGFKWKPGDPWKRPGLVAPFQPRLDWQLWFAALGDREENPWFDSLCLRLLQGSPAVLALLGTNPFPQRPPRYLRARLYDYRFTDFSTRRATGAWWKRTLSGNYLPAVSLGGAATP
ncbi:MAG: lipase maturation factor family protein, partial [bacterium]